jgi:hypothetical protein
MRAPAVAAITVDVAGLISAIVWPALILILALTYRQAIQDAAQAALRRGFKVGLPVGLSFELPGATEAPLRWLSGRPAVDLRHPVPSAAITDSTRAEFSAQLRDRTPAEYARVDLGHGQEWLTSRLYFMAIVLQRLRGLGAFVFLEALETSHHFVGWALLEEVRWALARRFPRLERAFVEASFDLATQAGVVLGRGETLSIPPEGSPPTPPDHPLIVEAPAQLLASFLNHIQLPGPGLPEPPTEWVPLSTPTGGGAGTTYEYGQWLNALLLQDILRANLVTTSIRENELLAKPEAEQASLIAAHEGRYVALTHDDGRFSRLIDRRTMMGQIALATMQRPA